MAFAPVIHKPLCCGTLMSIEAHRTLTMSKRLLTATIFLAAPLSTASTLAQIIGARKAPCEKIAAGLAYDVVSIHPSKPSGDMNNWSYNMGTGDDNFRATNVQLSQILQFAYDLPEDQIANVNGPAADTHFDIEAKVTGSDPATPVKLTDHQLQCMVVPLLVDRFRLKTHTETRIRPIYELIVAKGGHKMTPAPDTPEDGLNMGFSNNDWKLTAHGESMTDFAASLSQARHRPILDKTGLPGRFTFTLTWTSEDDTDTDANAAPGLTTALQEQLGLKLQSTKGPVDTLVVDHVEMPSEN
jgi:uncharacterized protein (TIGR03435 family)